MSLFLRSATAQSALFTAHIKHGRLGPIAVLQGEQMQLDTVRKIVIGPFVFAADRDDRVGAHVERQPEIIVLFAVPTSPSAISPLNR